LFSPKSRWDKLFSIREDDGDGHYWWLLPPFILPDAQVDIMTTSTYIQIGFLHIPHGWEEEGGGGGGGGRRARRRGEEEEGNQQFVW